MPTEIELRELLYLNKHWSAPAENKKSLLRIYKFSYNSNNQCQQKTLKRNFLKIVASSHILESF